jgi:hypothetical protein
MFWRLKIGIILPTPPLKMIQVQVRAVMGCLAMATAGRIHGLSTPSSMIQVAVVQSSTTPVPNTPVMGLSIS